MAQQFENLNYDDRGGDTGLGTGGTLGPNTTDSGTTIPGKSNITPTSPTTLANGGTTGSNGNSNNTTQSTYGVNAPNPEKLKNPLSVFSSYNYQLSLYMMTPQAYRVFVESGRKNINAINFSVTSETDSGNKYQAYIIAQSGGVNRKENRAPGIIYDYYIDNLKIEIATSGKATLTATNATEISFQIVEQYGFNFATLLRRARDKIVSISGGKGGGAARQIFLLGIRFLGYDKDGNLVTGKESFAGKTLNQTGSLDGIFETYFDIQITEFKYSIDGKNVIYNITAAPIAPSTAFGRKYGVIDNGVELQGETVGDMFNNLMDKLNRTSQNINGNPNTYKLVFRDNAQKIKNAKMVYKTNNEVKQKAPSEAKTILDVNDAKAAAGAIKIANQNILDANDARVAAANRSANIPILDANDARVAAANRTTETNRVTNANERVLSFAKGTSILQAVDQIVAQSTYLQDALLVLKKSTAEQQGNTNNKTQVSPTNNEKVSWYHISAEVKPNRTNYWDDTRNDFSWEITYFIELYETPSIVSPYVSNRGYYYGPVKRYEYWYSGTNSEILSYKQDLNYNYYMTNLIGVNDKTTPPKQIGIDAPVIPNKVNDQNRSGSKNEGAEAVNSYRTSLYDPGSWAEAKIEILGDPDFLIQGEPAPLSTVYDRFYNNNGTINANGGQVFIEINFKEAIDYNKETGLMDINSSIFFYEYPKEVRDKIQGLSYQVVKCTSTFNQGKFKQNLDLVINTMNDVVSTLRDKENPKPSTSNSSGGAKNPTPAERDRLANNRTLLNNFAATDKAGSITVNTKAGPVVTDDGSEAGIKKYNQETLGMILNDGRRGG